MRISIITASHGRPHILRAWCLGIERLRSETRDIDVDIDAVCVSDKWDNELCRVHWINHIAMDNNPVTDKFNRAVSVSCRVYNPDYVMVLGSDDLMSTKTFVNIVRTLEESETPIDVIGISNIYFFNTEGTQRGSLVQLRGERMLGVGKTISRRVLEEVGCRPWGKEKNWGMDSVLTQTIAPFVKKTVVLHDQKVFDLKSKESLNKFSLWANKFQKEDPNIFWNNIGEREKKLVENIIKGDEKRNKN
jgi:hypothetical protein